MKKFLHNFKMWMVALVAMFAGTAFAQTPDVTFQFSVEGYSWESTLGASMWSQNGVTVLAKNFNDRDNTCNTWNGELNVTAETWGWIKVSSEERAITKIVVYGGQNYVASVGTFEGATWTGNANDVVISTYTDEYLTKVEVYLAEGAGTGSGSDVNYATITNFSPNATVSLDDNEYGLHYFSLYFDANLTADYGSYSGQSIDGFSLTDAAGNSFALSYVQGWNGSNSVNFASADAITTAGTYTFHAPEGIFKFEGNKVNAELNLVWTLTPAEKFAFGWGDAQAQGTKKEGASEWDPFKTLTGFKVNAPEGVEFDHLAEGATLQTREYDEEANEYKYVDVEGATVALVDGAVVITLAEAITEQGYYNYVLAEGSVFATDGRYNKELSLSANVDPYSYFELGLEPSETLVSPFNKLTIALPADVTVSEVGETFAGSYWQDGNVDLTFNVTSYEQNGQNLVLNFTGGDAVPFETWFHISFPQGFVKTADEFYLSSSKSVWNNWLVEGEEPTTDENEQIYADWKQLVTETMKAVYDAYEEWPTEDVVGEKPAKVIYDVCNYYQSTSWLFSAGAGFGDDWAAAAAYYEGLGSTLAEEYAEALAIWEAYENAEVVTEPEEVTLEEEGVATGFYSDYYGDDLGFDEVPVAYEKYSDGSIVLKNFWKTGKDLTFRCGEPYDYEGYKFADVESIDDVEGFGGIVEQSGYTYYNFENDLEYNGETCSYFMLSTYTYYMPDYNQLTICYLSGTYDDFEYFTVAFDYPFEGEDPTGINTVIAADNNKIYDLAGRRVVKAQKGLNIVNGKVILK